MSSAECEIVVRYEGNALDVQFDGADATVRVSKKKVAPFSNVDKERLQPGARLRVTCTDDGAVTRIDDIVADAPGFDPQAHNARIQQQERARPAREARRREHDADEPGANPYTFLPFASPPPTARETTPRHRTAPWDQEDATSLLSGSFTVQLSVHTPLCVLGRTENRQAEHRWTQGRFQRLSPETQDEHAVIHPAVDRQDRPTIPGSSLKGALRSWLEVITSSRRLIDESPVSWRATSLERTSPARISIRDADGNAVGDLLRDGWNPKDQRLKHPITVTLEPLTLWHPPTPAASFEESQRALARCWDLPADRELVDDLPVRSKESNNHGRLKVAASPGNDPVASLHVFMDRPNSDPLRVDRDVVERWCLAHQPSQRTGRAAHTTAGEVRIPTDQGDMRCRVGRARTDVLAHGMLVWYRTDESDTVHWFGRIRNGRWAERYPMEARTPKGHGRASNGKLTVAEQLFGTADEAEAISQQADPNTDGSQPIADAWAGQVRVTPARWASNEDPSFSWLTLKALSSPKLQSAGMYLRTDDTRPLTWSHRAPSTETHESDPTAGKLAGTKVYWHVPPVPGESPTSRVKVERQETQQGQGKEDIKTEQNATVKALTNGTLAFEVSFEDLRPEEVGALLLACSLRFTTTDDAARGWKLGIGKPLGLGSIENQVGDLRLFDLARRYDDPVEPFAGLDTDHAAGWTSEELQRQARQHYLEGVSERFVDTLEAVVRLDSMNGHPVKYPSSDAFTGRNDGSSHQWPTALETLRGIYRPTTPG